MPALRNGQGEENIQETKRAELLKSPEVQDIKDDIAHSKAIEAITKQDGGKIIVTALEGDVVSDIDTVLSLYKAPELDLRAAVAKLKADLQLLRVYKRSPANRKAAEDALAAILNGE